ncbi:MULTISPECIES: ABC-three component system protein [Exiguobacterium]|uniref:ABC-three component systems C-terminal domain-containing protein n=1 Tax=Exiguobacterium profundum TaxID=307643 RepID=A0ABY8B1V4_9BACL|nr:MULTISPECIES: ABC-three component system protein [Exiguobacterium]WED55003.1 hypothetical protein OE059_13385 [Exiguobacterium profundum]
MSTQFSAHAQALGYFYQVRYALFLLLKASDDSCIYIEKLDDISFDNDGTPLELIQTKHHINARGSLSNASSDIWKTIRVWSEGILDRELDEENTKFTLISNDIAIEGSAASLLSAGSNRNIEAAMEILINTAETSSSNSNKKAYEKFLELTDEQKKAFLRNTIILDCADNIAEAKEKILHEIRYVTRPKHVESVYERLEGIWFDKVIKHLLTNSNSSISHRELQEKLHDLQEQFSRDNLPIDFFNAIVPTEKELKEDERIFVEQLKLIEISNRRIEKAISDYYKAFKQRSKWIRDDLIIIDELNSYEERLIDEWERKFEIMIEDIGKEKSKDIFIKKGRALFNWMDGEAEFNIRKNCDEPYVVRGSYHMLANKLKVGWHLEFIERLGYLLGNITGDDQ